MDRSRNLRARGECTAPGFGNVLWKGIREAVDADGFIGLFMGGFKAGAGGDIGRLDLWISGQSGVQTQNEVIK